MAGKAGFDYEKKINKLLKEHALQSLNFRDAGADSSAPDSLLVINRKGYRTEIKLDLKVDFGQGSLEYDIKKGKWILSGVDTDAAEQMRELLMSIGTLTLINSTRGWGGKGVPRKFTVPLSKFKQADSDYDQKHFTDKYIVIPDINSIAKYYAKKKTHYIQIGGGYGLYHFVNDVAGIGTTKFMPKIRLRIRRKRGGSYPIHNYRFSTALQVTSLPKSEIDLDNIDDVKAIAARNK